MTDVVDLIERLTAARTGFASSYDAGRNAAINGPNCLNTNFIWFNSAESTAEWERGNRDGKAEGKR